MANLIQTCPVCRGKLTVSSLHCSQCGLSLQNEFELNAFNYLEQEQMDFLIEFLRCRGNLKMLQERLNISYPLARKKLEALLTSLKLEGREDAREEPEENDVRSVSYQEGSMKASDVIKEKLAQNGGRATVRSITDKPYEIRIGRDGKNVDCRELPLYAFSVFDVIVECLLKNGGTAQKGNGRNFKLGEAQCDDTTVVGYIGRHYAGKKDGDSVFDPVFVLAAVLDWAGIARNCRGYLELMPAYRAGLDRWEAAASSEE